MTIAYKILIGNLKEINPFGDQGIDERIILRFMLNKYVRVGFRVKCGRAIAQAVSRRLPTAATQVRFQVRLCGICGGQSGTGAGFLRILRFPLPILIPPTTPHSSSSIIRGWYNRPNSDRRTTWTQSHPTPPQELIKKKY
jgi:hypothetical protein